jgi:heptose I phosphotransferase
VNHQDFYLGHFFIPAEQPLEGEPRLFLVDLQRLGRRRAVPRRYLVKDLGELLYSADRFPQLSRADKLRFLRFYLQERPLSSRAKRLARAVIAKASRIARHSRRAQARRA